MPVSRATVLLITGGALVAVVAAAVTVVATSNGSASNKADSSGRGARSPDRPHLRSRDAVCAVEADAASDVFIARGTSDAVTEQVAAALGTEGDGGKVLQIVLRGVAAYNEARHPPTNASQQNAVLAMTRRNRDLCAATGNPILNRVQVELLSQLAGAGAVLLSDVDVFADDRSNVPPSPSAAGGGDVTVTDCGGQPPTARPATLHVRCGGGAFITIDGITWQTWGGARAQGRGTVHVTDCVPDCAHGHDATAPVRIILSAVSSVAGSRRYTLLDAIPPEGDSFHVMLPT